jgi:hypothetical protein
MGQVVVAGAQTMCSFGLAPAPLNVLPVNLTMAGGPPAATIMDHVPELNIMPYGMCTSLANPMVAAATAAALGVLTPMPCLPATTAPWVPGSPTVLIKGMPVLTNESKCMCMWGGVIQVMLPGQFTVEAP